MSANPDPGRPQQFHDALERLEWRIEEGLARIFGDIAAHRIAGAARELIALQGDAAVRVAGALAEAWGGEAPLLVRGAALTAFAGEVASLREAGDELERRVAALEQRVDAR